MLEIYNGDLNVEEITHRWYQKYRTQNCGAFIHFIGVIRDEDDIDGLSFDIYEPVLKDWLEDWQDRVKKDNAKILMAHSLGDVLIHKSSYIAGVLSPKRKVALKLINDFVEDFKKNAPIWKYELKQGKRIYSQHQSQSMNGAGLLSGK